MAVDIAIQSFHKIIWLIMIYHRRQNRGEQTVVHREAQNKDRNRLPFTGKHKTRTDRNRLSFTGKHKTRTDRNRLPFTGKHKTRTDRNRQPFRGRQNKDRK